MNVFDPNAAAAPGSGLYGLPHSPDEAQVVIVPVPFEATTSYGGGAAKGPEAVLEASKQVDLFDVETASRAPPPRWHDQHVTPGSRLLPRKDRCSSSLDLPLTIACVDAP